MATDDPRHRYQNALKRLEKANDGGDITDADHVAIEEFLAAIDPDNFNHQFMNGAGEQEMKQPGTMASYAQALKQVGTFADAPILEMDHDDVNELFSGLADGTHPAAKDSGYGKSTLSQWQAAVSKFYQYHSGPADPNQIVVVAPPESKVDEEDMFTPEEVQALRDAVTNTRDRCLLELFLNTGQRIRAIQTLKYGDVKPDDGVTGSYKLNSDIDGLKGADEVQRKRPLLGAKRAVKDWKQHHPTQNPDDFLITILPSANRGEPGAELSQSTIRRTMRKLADRAEIDHPERASNVHNFRHHFVTICKRNYDMDGDVIKRLIGHDEDSRIMERVYSHLTDDDIIEKAEVAVGERDPEEEGALTPATCPTCDEPLPNYAKSCPRCGQVFTPDAQAVKDQLDQDLWQSKGEADAEQEEAVDKLKRLLDENPELVDELID